MKKDFTNFLETLKKSILPWDFFVDFDKVKKNTSDLRIELNILNSLVGSEDIDKDFISLIERYPEVRRALPILLAMRSNHIKYLEIVKDKKDIYSENKGYLFKGDLTPDIKKELLVFFKQSGLKDVFLNKEIKNVFDYVFGIEVGMDTNARKNRTGTIMETIVEENLKLFCANNDSLSYLSQATKSKIKDVFGVDIEIDKNNRSFDFALFSKKTNRLYLFEVNYYSGGGSKLKSVAGEFEKLYSFLGKQDIKFIWITDGMGWLTTRRSLEEAYIKNDGCIYNLAMLKDNLLSNLIK